ncbi:sulfatase [Salinibaculum salinum]|uniref:sulfatase n=1 Tax=Salinibaculum salinum TaxID=3131996 RepID=UPI0030EE9FE7
MATSNGPNVLFVVLDTVRKDRLSVYGYDRPTTPTLETFAEEARVYEHAVAPAPWTLPVHASLFTGLYPSEHNATQETPYLEDSTTLAESLSAAGYATSCYSSNAWITPYTHLTDGFDDQDNFFKVMPGDTLSRPLARIWKTMNDNDRLRSLADRLVELGNSVHERLAAGGGEDSKTPAVIDQTQSFIDDADGPFFSFLNLMDAHLPYHPPEEYVEQFAPGVDSTEVCQNSKAYNCGARDIDDEEWEDIQGLYDAEIRHMDDQLGRLFDWLKAEELWEETMVVVCADHGELHGEHDLYGHEFNIYDPLVNVPLLVKHPEIAPGRDEDCVELLDLYHTLLDATGVEGQGQPLDPNRSLLADAYRDIDLGDHAFVEYHRPVVELNQLESKASEAGITLDADSRFYSRMRAARRPDAKYIRNERIADEAYRLDSDPGEADDVVDDDDEAIAATEAALSAFEERVGGEWDEVGESDPLADMGDEAKDRLRDLGYVE